MTIFKILDFKPIYVILIYLYLAHIVFQERTKHHLHESSIRIPKFENLAVWWDYLEILDFKPIYVILMYLDVTQIVF